MERYNVQDVFTPTRPAMLTFVERPRIDSKIASALRTPGKQLVVYGHSGSGKTTALVNMLQRYYEAHITTRCVSGMTFDQMVLDAFDQLGSYYQAERVQRKTSHLNVGLSAEYLTIKGRIGLTRGSAAEVKEQRVLPPQLTVQRLATFVGAAGRCWVLEDFHKVQKPEKTKLAEAMKVFMDSAVDYPDAKIIAIGAVDTAREVVQYEPNMHGRVAEVLVPLMTDEEIMQILLKAEPLMNVSFATSIRKGILPYASGLASVCHQLGLNMCNVRDITTTCDEKLKFVDGDFEQALSKYVEEESDSLKYRFDIALHQQRKRKFDNCRIILSAIAMSNSELGLTKGELIRKIRQEVPEYPTGNLSLYLPQLETEDRGALLRHSPASQRYDYANPFYKVFARMLLHPRDQQVDWSAVSATFADVPESLAAKLGEIMAAALVKSRDLQRKGSDDGTEKTVDGGN